MFRDETDKDYTRDSKGHANLPSACAELRTFVENAEIKGGNDIALFFPRWTRKCERLIGAPYFPLPEVEVVVKFLFSVQEVPGSNPV
jgi:hypothetical protein